MASKKTKKAPKPVIHIGYKESRSGGEPINPEDSWPDYEQKYIHVLFRGYKTKHENNFAVQNWFHELEVPEGIRESALKAEPIFIVVARYSDGGTFGSTSGHWQILHFTTDKREAYRLEMEIESSGECNGDIYPSWEGYFSGWENCETHELVCLD